jgi:hypothetical protein
MLEKSNRRWLRGDRFQKIQQEPLEAFSPAPSPQLLGQSDFYPNNQNYRVSQTPVAHTCNPSYSGGRDQEDHGSKSAWGNSLQDPISKKPFTKIWLVEWLKVKALSSNPSTAKQHNEKPPQDRYQYGDSSLLQPPNFPGQVS